MSLILVSSVRLRPQPMLNDSFRGRGLRELFKRIRDQLDLEAKNT